ncbi:MAG: Rnf-Nqr domain containing protein [Desulfomonilaceae bacterium]|nr:Rnf-Nqr domain containing protein [Desulfomonilaceae bacterium]
MKIIRFLAAAGTVLALLVIAACPIFAATEGSGDFKNDKGIEIPFGVPVDESWAKDPANYNVYEKPDPDIRIPVDSISLDARRTTATLNFKDPLNTGAEYIVDATDITSDGKVIGSRSFLVKKGEVQILLAIILGAMLINNFVFTKYLGLCIFFGVSQKKETAIGMGITFTLVMTLAAFFCWFLYNYVLEVLHLDFLKIIVFIGTTAIFVQFVDTILRKVNPYLFKTLGVYLVLIVTNCIVLAVPLIQTDSGYGPFESVSLGAGAGVGFAIALFLMACVREKLDVCRVPPTFVGLPIAFIVTGMFALAFLGFSGLSIF